jgi:hypothetical protein
MTRDELLDLFRRLIEIALPTYDSDTCPLCGQGLPVVKPGSRAVTA